MFLGKRNTEVKITEVTIKAATPDQVPFIKGAVINSYLGNSTITLSSVEIINGKPRKG